MIRSSIHHLKFSNTGKIQIVSKFIDEYRRVAGIIVDQIWNNGYETELNGVLSIFSPKENLLHVPKYIDYKKFDIETSLTARAMSSLTTQICGILSAATEKQRKRIYILEKMKSDGIPKEKRSRLIKKIKQNIPQKPNCSNINPELSSKCCSWFDSASSFNGFIKLSAILKGTSPIYIPIKFHRHAKKLISVGGEMKTSFLIKKECVNIRWEVPDTKRKIVGDVVGADQGIKTTLTLSDSQTTGKDIHGHDLDSIMDKMARCKKGSKSFRRTQEHRKNYINWAINQIDFSKIKEIRLEKIWNIGYKSSKNRKLSHFTNTIIRDKVEKTAIENGVHFVEQDSTYRSQRCSECGLVRKANRKGKEYICSDCGNILDADFNASRNHEQTLPEIPYTLRKRNLNRGHGFFWKETGFYDFTGRSLESLPPVEDILPQII